MSRMLNRDADPVFAARQIEQIRAQALAPALAPLKSRQLIPTNNEVSEAVNTYTYRQWDVTGKAAWMADKATDMPKVNASGKETSVKPYTFWTGFDISRQEMLAAQFANVPLDQRLGFAARRAVEEFFEAVARSGDTEKGLLGFVNQTGTTTYTVPADGTGTSKLWSAKSGELILRDLHGVAQKIVTDTKEVEAPDTLVLPTDEFALISTTPYNEHTEKTILDVFLSASRYINTVVPWTACDGAGAEAANRMVAYRRSPDVLEHVIPAEFTMMPTETLNAGFLYQTACYGRTGGVVVYRPKAICYADGI